MGFEETRRSPHGTGARDLSQEGQGATAVITTKRFGFRELRRGFVPRAEQQADAQTGPGGGAAQKAVVADAGEAFGQDVEQPASNELMGMKPQDAGLPGVAGGPAQEDLSVGIVAEQTLRGKGAALDVAGEIAQRGGTSSGGLELHVPLSGGSQGAERLGSERGEEIGMGVSEGEVETAAEPVGQRMIVHQEAFFGRMDESVALGGKSHRRNDEVDVGMMLHLASPGVEDAGEAGAASLGLGGDDIGQCARALAEHEIVENLRMGQAEASEFGGQGEGDHEIGHREESGLLPGGPDLLVERAALGTVAVVATVVGKVGVMAIIAAVEPAAHLGSAARQSAPHRPVMGRGESRAVAPGIARPMLAQHLCESERHRSEE